MNRENIVFVAKNLQKELRDFDVDTQEKFRRALPRFAAGMVSGSDGGEAADELRTLIEDLLAGADEHNVQKYRCSSDFICLVDILGILTKDTPFMRLSSLSRSAHRLVERLREQN